MSPHGLLGICGRERPQRKRDNDKLVDPPERKCVNTTYRGHCRPGTGVATGTTRYRCHSVELDRVRTVVRSSVRSSADPVLMLSNKMSGDHGAADQPFYAERVGFEPTVSFPTHDFQSCRFGRSRT